MEIMEKAVKKPSFPLSGLPRLPRLAKNSATPAPDEETCMALWRKYKMPANIQAHSRLVACIAAWLARRAQSLGMPVSPEACQASGLLHDIAKAWCLKYGGSHAILGAAWAVAETGNFLIGQGVLLHVHWPWPFPEGDAICCLPIFVMYADKRVKHDECVTLKERFEDLLVRYGHTPHARAGIKYTLEQVKILERRLSEKLQWNLDEYSFDCRRLVN